MNVLISLGRWGLNIIYFFHKLFPSKNRIAIISRQSREPSLDMRLLTKELERQDPEVEVVICCKMIDPGLFHKIGYVLHMVTKQMHLLATSKVVVLDGYCIAACMLKHKRSLIILQMWHSMGALKNFGYASLDAQEGTSAKLAKAMRMHEQYDMIFVSSEACKKPWAKAFHCDESILKVMPLPRCDAILNDSYRLAYREAILKEYPKLIGKKVVLYAPTFRKEIKIYDAMKTLIDRFDEQKYCFIVKLHPLDEGKVQTGEAIVDTQFSSLEWFSVADIVISDYSAILFEAALAHKPLYRYVPDAQSYDYQRGFLIDVDREIPAFSSPDAFALYEAIENENYDLTKIDAFAHKYIKANGHNAKDMASYILMRCTDD